MNSNIFVATHNLFALQHG